MVVRLNEEILKDIDEKSRDGIIDVHYIDSTILEYIALEDITTFEVEHK